MESLEKHKKYKELYGKNEVYWGLGVEEETYLQFDKLIKISPIFIKTCHKPERYSVRYFDNYKENYKDQINLLFPDSIDVELPLFVNSHGFQRMDVKGNHRTTYEKIPKPNPNFLGKTFFELLPIFFQENLDKWFVFDGDTLEFMTQNFYKTNVKKCIKELIEYKKLFLHTLNKFIKENNLFLEKGIFMYPKCNPGFVVHITNPKNVSMFNNGTYHINITLPTYLGTSGEVLFPEKFREDHRRFIRLIQWLEPFFISLYGTPDPFSKVSNSYSKASQRSAVSRYIGIGTFDTDKMPEGKCNTLPLTEIPASSGEYWWYRRYHETSGYRTLESLGMDINYRKHFQHGVELRFFDWFPEEKLEELLEIIVCIAEASYKLPLAPPASFQQSWNDCVIGVMKEGVDFSLTREIRGAYEKHLNIDLFQPSVKGVWEEIKKGLCVYKKGKVAKLFLAKN